MVCVAVEGSEGYLCAVVKGSFLLGGWASRQGKETEVSVTTVWHCSQTSFSLPENPLPWLPPCTALWSLRVVVLAGLPAMDRGTAALSHFPMTP